MCGYTGMQPQKPTYHMHSRMGHVRNAVAAIIMHVQMVSFLPVKKMNSVSVQSANDPCQQKAPTFFLIDVMSRFLLLLLCIPVCSCGL